MQFQHSAVLSAPFKELRNNYNYIIILLYIYQPTMFLNFIIYLTIYSSFLKW